MLNQWSKERIHGDPQLFPTVSWWFMVSFVFCCQTILFLLFFPKKLNLLRYVGIMDDCCRIGVIGGFVFNYICYMCYGMSRLFQTVYVPIHLPFCISSMHKTNHTSRWCWSLAWLLLLGQGRRLSILLPMVGTGAVRIWCGYSVHGNVTSTSWGCFRYRYHRCGSSGWRTLVRIWGGGGCCSRDCVSIIWNLLVVHTWEVALVSKSYMYGCVRLCGHWPWTKLQWIHSYTPVLKTTCPLQSHRGPLLFFVFIVFFKCQI